MHPSNVGVLRRAVAVLMLTPLVFGLLAVPASAHKSYSQKPVVPHCDKFDMALAGDRVIENPSVKMYDQQGNLLVAKVAVAVVVDAQLVVCVDVDAEADVDIALEAVVDDDKNGKKDTVVVRADVDAKADVNVKISAKVEGKVGLSVGVALRAALDVAVKGGEKKSYRCKGKDGYDQY